MNTSHPHTAIGPGGIIFSERQIGDISWPSDLILDVKLGNWLEWSRRLTLLADRIHLSGYLEGTLPCPDISLYPAAHDVWMGNDGSLRAFILEHVTSDEFDVASTFDTSHAVFEGLRTRQEKLGLYAQINLLRKASNIYYEPTVPMAATTTELRGLSERIKKMGKIDADKIFAILIINSLGRHYPHLQTVIHEMTNNPNFTTSLALKQLANETALEERRAKLGFQHSAVALITGDKDAKPPGVICQNCKRPHHTIEFCVKPGGKMAGRSLCEAKAAQRAVAGKPPRASKAANMNHTADVATTGPPSTSSSAGSPSQAIVPLAISGAMTGPVAPYPPSSITVNGSLYLLAPTSSNNHQSQREQARNAAARDLWASWRWK